MNVNLLRLARRHASGVRAWRIPGAGNAAKIVPASKSWWPGTMAVYWPSVDPRNGEECLRGARLDWHKSIIRAELRKLPEPVAHL